MFVVTVFFFFIPEIAASEPRVNRKQPLYLHEGVVRPAYTLSSQDVTCGISLGIQLDQHNRTNCQAVSVVWIGLLQALPSLICNSNFWISARYDGRIDAVFSVSSREFPWTVFSGMQAMETGNNGISQFELSTESTSGPCICPTKDEQRSTKEEVVSANFPHHQSGDKF